MQVEQLAEISRRSYSAFCKLIQDDGWFDKTHERLCDAIQEKLESSGFLKELREPNEEKPMLNTCKIAVVMPRGSLKSTMVTRNLSLWLTIQDPNIRILIGSNSSPNATKKIEDIRGIVDSNELFRALFPEVLPTTDQRWTNQAAELRRTKTFPEATYEAAGVKTRVTGRHFNVIIEDDTLAPDESDSGVEMALPSIEDTEKAIGWHKLGLPLLVPRGLRLRVIVTTRWSDYDLIDYIQKHEPDYLIIDIPALVDGKPQFEAFYSQEQLDEFARDLGPYLFSCLYLNSPIPAGERVFDPKWFQYCRTDQIHPDAYYAVSIDPAVSDKDDACDTAIIGCWHHNHFIWVADVLHGKFSPQETIMKALDLLLSNEEKARCLIVETVAYQKALTYFIRDEMQRRRMYVPIVKMESRTAKEVRIRGLQPLFANGQIIFFKGLAKALETQLVQFPHGKLVDVIDALAMHLKLYRGIVIEEAKQIVKDDTNSFEAICNELRKRNKPIPGSLKTGLEVESYLVPQCELAGLT